MILPSSNSVEIETPTAPATMSVSWFPRRKVGIATDPSSLLKREQTKAAHYIQLLDEARCQGNWDAVPELVRKVKKHAPNRACTSKKKPRFSTNPRHKEEVFFWT